MKLSFKSEGLLFFTALLLANINSAFAAERQNDSKPPIPLEQRIKEAHKPWSWLIVDQMSVPPDQADAYIKIEAQWLEIHNELARRGKLINWRLWKVSDPKEAGYEYLTAKLFNSLSDAESVYNWDEIAEFYGRDKLSDLLKRTEPTRKIIHSESWELADYTVLSNSKTNLSRITLGLIKAAAGKQEDYEKMEKNILSKYWQGVAEKDPRFAGWQFGRLFSFSGDRPKYDYSTVCIHNADAKSTKGEQPAKVFDIGGPAAEKSNLEKLREIVKVVTMEKVMETSPESNPILSEWKKLTGSWKAPYTEGGYRIKRISPFWEELEDYDKDGKLTDKLKCPMKIEVRDGLNHFYSLHEDGTWQSIYKVHENVWYEQLPSIFRTLDFAKPNDFLIYHKVDK